MECAERTARPAREVTASRCLLLPGLLVLGTSTLAGCVDLGRAAPPAPEAPDAASEDTEGSDGPAARARVTLFALRFSPTTITIARGTTVEWTNRDAVVHTVTEGTPEGTAPRLFDSPMLSTGATFRFTFHEAGDWLYFCRTHANIMRDNHVVVR